MSRRLIYRKSDDKFIEYSYPHFWQCVSGGEYVHLELNDNFYYVEEEYDNLRSV